MSPIKYNQGGTLSGPVIKAGGSGWVVWQRVGGCVPGIWLFVIPSNCECVRAGAQTLVTHPIGIQRELGPGPFYVVYIYIYIYIYVYICL